MNRPHIPRTWTGEQALAIAELLQHLIDDIHRVHGEQMRLVYLRRRSAGDQTEEADIPF